jgi:hypothetical protein
MLSGSLTAEDWQRRGRRRPIAAGDDSMRAFATACAASKQAPRARQGLLQLAAHHTHV